MAVGDGWESQLLAGLAQKLHNAGIGVWKPSGAYTAGETAITDQAIPPTPDRLITLTAYLETGPPGMQDVTVAVQFRLRGTTDPRVCRDIGDAIYELLDGSGRQLWGDIPIVDVTRQSHAPLGRDGSNRWEASHNYLVQAMRRTNFRTD